MLASSESCSSRRFELQHFRDEQTLADEVAKRWLGDLARIRGGDYFAALSGGRIARRFFESIARFSPQFGDPLAAVHFFWADERCVPPDHAESNYAAAEEHVFRPLKLREDRIHRIRGELAGDQAAKEAEVEMARLVPVNESGLPVLDMVFLGMGEDGHVASLFPNDPAERSPDSAVYRAVVAAKPPPRRITLGYGALIAARQVWVLVSGRDKESALEQSLGPQELTPLGKVLRFRRRTVIFTDIPLSSPN